MNEDWNCAHTLWTTVALHGYWTQYSRKRHPIPRSLDEFKGLSSLINSCMLWGEDGPIMEEIRAILAETPRGQTGTVTESNQ